MSIDSQLTLVRQLEEAAADAVPPAVLEPLDGWRLRFNHGVKRRPNSVLANVHTGTLAVADKVRRAEAFYEAYGMRARFQLSPASSPQGLEALLEARGYLRAPDAVSVQTLEIERFARLSLPKNVTLLTSPTPEWTQLYLQTEGLVGPKADAFCTMLARLPGQSGFALALDREGRPAATALGVAHAGLLGIFNVATSPHARRQGLATEVTRALLSWGSGLGLARAYLQVSERNSPAQALYARLGFCSLYSYGYLEAP